MKEKHGTYVIDMYAMFTINKKSQNNVIIAQLEYFNPKLLLNIKIFAETMSSRVTSPSLKKIFRIACPGTFPMQKIRWSHLGSHTYIHISLFFCSLKESLLESKVKEEDKHLYETSKQKMG